MALRWVFVFTIWGMGSAGMADLAPNSSIGPAPDRAPLAEGAIKLDGPGFAAVTAGKTITFAMDGRVMGAEQYLHSNRVLWTFFDDNCQHGRWWEAEGQICFTYEDNPERQICWGFYQIGDQIAAYLNDERDTAPLLSLQIAQEPLICAGPLVGS